MMHYIMKIRVKDKKESLGVTQQTISKDMEMIEKQGNQMLYELKPRGVGRRLFESGFKGRDGRKFRNVISER